MRLVSANYFDALGITPDVGRPFRSDDRAIAVVSHDFWTRKLRADPEIYDKTLGVQGNAIILPSGNQACSVAYLMSAWSAELPDCCSPHIPPWTPSAVPRHVGCLNVERVSKAVSGTDPVDFRTSHSLGAVSIGGCGAQSHELAAMPPCGTEADPTVAS